MMYSQDLNDASEVVENLKIGRDLHGCAVALLGMHRVFGIKSSVEEENSNEIMIHANDCMWKDKMEWGPDVCASYIL